MAPAHQFNPAMNRALSWRLIGGVDHDEARLIVLLDTAAGSGVRGWPGRTTSMNTPAQPPRWRPASRNAAVGRALSAIGRPAVEHPDILVPAVKRVHALAYVEEEPGPAQRRNSSAPLPAAAQDGGCAVPGGGGDAGPCGGYPGGADIQEAGHIPVGADIQEAARAGTHIREAVHIRGAVGSKAPHSANTFDRMDQDGNLADTDRARTRSA